MRRVQGGGAGLAGLAFLLLLGLIGVAGRPAPAAPAQARPGSERCLYLPGMLRKSTLQRNTVPVPRLPAERCPRFAGLQPDPDVTPGVTATPSIQPSPILELTPTVIGTPSAGTQPSPDPSATPGSADATATANTAATATAAAGSADATATANSAATATAAAGSADATATANTAATATAAAGSADATATANTAATATAAAGSADATATANTAATAAAGSADATATANTAATATAAAGSADATATANSAATATAAAGSADATATANTAATATAAAGSADATATANSAATATAGAIPSSTPSPTATTDPADATATAAAATATAIAAASASATPSRTVTLSPTVTPSRTTTPSPTASLTPDGSATATASPTSALTPTATAAGPSDIQGPLGVQIFGDDTAQDLLNALSGAHASFARVPLQWGFIEPVDVDPPQYNWYGLDGVVIALTRSGLQPMVVLYGNPSWAATEACGPVDKVPLSRFQAFVQAMVERYDADGTEDAPGSPRMAHWEIGNEPDYANASGGTGADHGSCFGGGRAAAYGDLLRASAKAIHQADASAKVLFGGVAYDRFYNGPPGYSPSGPFDYDFVSAVLSHLTQNYGAEAGFPFVDWMSLHIYNDYRNNWDGAQPYGQELAAKLQRFREQQLRRVGAYDLRQLPIAITEVGLPSGPADPYTYRDEALQAAYPGQVLLRSLAEGVPMVLWFVGKDRFTGSCGDIYAWQTFGMLRSRAVALAAAACPTNPLGSYSAAVDNLPKASLSAFRTAQAQLAGLTFDGTLALALTGSPQIEAYRFKNPATGAYLLAAFTDSGERLGRRNQGSGKPTPVARVLRLGPTLLPGWTGKVKVTDHLGVSSVKQGSTVDVNLTEAPVYLEAMP